MAKYPNFSLKIGGDKISLNIAPMVMALPR
jgi:hypothetical protein